MKGEKTWKLIPSMYRPLSRLSRRLQRRHLKRRRRQIRPKLQFSLRKGPAKISIILPDSAPAWFADESFWKIYAPLMFNTARWELAEAEAERIIELLNLQGGDTVLDACCGVGRHALALAARGMKVTGVDCTKAYLDAAAGSAESEGLEVSLVQQDIREYTNPAAFTAAINMFTSFGYFDREEENLLILQNIHASLKPGGRILLDLLGKEVLARDFKESEWFEENGMIILQEHRIIRDWSRLENRWLLLHNGKRYDYTFSHAVYSAKEIIYLLKKAGFSTCEVYGDLNKAPYDNRASRLIATGFK
jgi:cyclopropane fatty-acyl-phospholipid synthase-like methyltransferase